MTTFFSAVWTILNAADRRNLSDRRGRGAQQSTGRRADPGPLRPSDRRLRTRQRPSRPRSPLRHRPDEIARRTRLGARVRRLRTVWPEPSSGTTRIRTGGGHTSCHRGGLLRARSIGGPNWRWSTRPSPAAPRAAPARARRFTRVVQRDRQREKMLRSACPTSAPSRSSISFEHSSRRHSRDSHRAVDKLVSVASGRAFAAWVDMREGQSFGTAFWLEFGSVPVRLRAPRGRQLLPVPRRRHRRTPISSTTTGDRAWPIAALNLGDPTAAIPWPISLDEAEISAKDQGNGVLADIVPMAPRRTLILGCRGQLGRALAREFPQADGVDLDEIDLSNPSAVQAWPWQEYDVVLDAAAYTAVDVAETAEGRRAASGCQCDRTRAVGTGGE